MELFRQGKIRRMHVRDKISERAIAKRMGLSRNTVHKWLQTAEEVKAPRYVRAKKFGKLAGFVDEFGLTGQPKLQFGRHFFDKQGCSRHVFLHGIHLDSKTVSIEETAVNPSGRPSSLGLMSASLQISFASQVEYDAIRLIADCAYAACVRGCFYAESR